MGQSSELMCAGIQLVNNMINTTFAKGKVFTTFDLSVFMQTPKIYEYCDGVNQQMMNFRPEKIRMDSKNAKKIDEALKDHEKITQYHPLLELFINPDWHVHNKTNSLY